MGLYRIVAILGFSIITILIISLEIYDLSWSLKVREKTLSAFTTNVSEQFGEYVDGLSHHASIFDNALLMMNAADAPHENVDKELLLHLTEILYFREILQVSIVDRQDCVKFSSLSGAPNDGKCVSLSDREHIQAIKKRETKFYLSTPLVGRVSNQWSLNFAKRVEDATGQYRGAIVLSLNPLELGKKFSSTAPLDGASISIFGPDGKIRGDCARGSESEGKPKCLPQSKAHALGKKGRATAASRKRREDPNPERSGKAINVKTKESQLDELKCWPGHHRVPGTKAGTPGSCAKNESVEEAQQCPECGGPMFSELKIGRAHV